METQSLEVVSHCPVCDAPAYGPRQASMAAASYGQFPPPVALRRSCDCHPLLRRELTARVMLAEATAGLAVCKLHQAAPAAPTS